jgi:hypothetical protein
MGTGAHAIGLAAAIRQGNRPEARAALHRAGSPTVVVVSEALTEPELGIVEPTLGAEGWIAIELTAT